MILLTSYWSPFAVGFALTHLSIGSLISQLECRQQQAKKIPSLVALDKLVSDSLLLPPGLWAKLQSTGSVSFLTEAHMYSGHESSFYSPVLCNCRMFSIPSSRQQITEAPPPHTHACARIHAHSEAPHIFQLLNISVFLLSCSCPKYPS